MKCTVLIFLLLVMFAYQENQATGFSACQNQDSKIIYLALDFGVFGEVKKR